MRCKYATHIWNPGWVLMRISLALPGRGREINEAVIWTDSPGYLNTSSGHWGPPSQDECEVNDYHQIYGLLLQVPTLTYVFGPWIWWLQKSFIKKKQREWEDFSYMPYLLPERAKGHVQYLVAYWWIIQVRRCRVVLSVNSFIYSIGWSQLHWLFIWVKWASTKPILLS